MNTLDKEIGRIQVDLTYVAYNAENSKYFLKQDYNSFALLEVAKNRSLKLELINLVKTHKDYKTIAEILLNKVKQ